MITAARASTRPGFAELIQGGVREYGRLLRMLLWSALPLGVAAGLGALGMHWAKDFGEKAKQFTITNFAWKKMVEGYLTVFKKYHFQQQCHKAAVQSTEAGSNPDLSGPMVLDNYCK